MRILYLNTSGALGGAETSLLSLLASVGTARPQWDLHLGVGEDGPLVGKATALGVTVHLLPFPQGIRSMGDSAGALPLFQKSLRMGSAMAQTLAYRGELNSLIRRIRPDLIHSNGLKMHLLSASARLSGTPLVWHVHDYLGRRSLARRAMRWSSNRAAVIVANSQSVARDLTGLGMRKPVVPVYNAIDVASFPAAGPKTDLDACCGLPAAAPGTVRAGLVATFAHWKGHRTFLAALAALPPDAAVRGYIIGGPIYRTSGSQVSLHELKDEARRLGLEGRVGFTGFLEDSAAAMRALDIVVHASTAPEPFGMVIAEAMACGKAVIASRGGGAAEIFEDGVNALGHAPGDAHELSEKLLLLARDAGLRRRLGAEGRRTVAQKFSGARLVRDLCRVYGSVCKAALVAGDAPVEQIVTNL